MKASQKILLASLLLLLAAAVTGVILTRNAALPKILHGGSKQPAPMDTPLVDLQPLRTARELAPLALTPDEQPLAQEAVRIADHDVDLAFAIALRQAAENPPPPTAGTKAISERLQAAQKLAQADQKQVTSLTKQLAGATGPVKEKLEEDLELARAQLELDGDELEDAKQDLMRAGGDLRGRIQRMVEEHEAGQHQDSQTAHSSAAAAPPQPFFRRGLAGEVTEWNRYRNKQALLLRARSEAQDRIERLKRDHKELEEHLKAERAKAPLLHRPSAPDAPPERPAAGTAESAVLIATAKHLSEDQKELASFDKRISDEQELGEIYSRWNELASAQTRAALHRVLLSILWVLVVLVVVVGFSGWLDHFFFKQLSPDRRRLVTLRTVLRVTMQAVGVIAGLLLIFGPPAQLATMIGLAGAGLTIALKDFIVGFFGWFVLMGKNGIRLGDWVEINGVSGEVMEIGLFRTVLLETGNWTDAGRPTGRRVTFVNSFAIEGHYFNFSTTGQWLWDELQIVIPIRKDPYPIADAIRKTVATETSENARLAEQEWQRATRSQEASAFTAEPAIMIRPAALGMEISVRYITRANERHKLRSKLYHEVVQLLGHKDATVNPPAETTPAPAAPEETA
jgi:small-conductance mechanosensitive channel